jgi:hypothetical protein
MSSSSSVSTDVVTHAPPAKRPFEMGEIGGFTKANKTQFKDIFDKGETRDLSKTTSETTTIDLGDGRKRDVTLQRHRSGSITETHGDEGGGGKHRAYHYSKTRDATFRAESRTDHGV